jgi:SAM-dependent methyltransferase
MGHDGPMGRGIAGKYGIDAWYVPTLSAVGAVFFVVLAIKQSPPSQYIDIAFAIFLTLQVIFYLHTSLRGKFRIWRRLIAQLPTPPAQILDVGCGRGMVLITALTAYQHAEGVGLDLWRSRDQTGNDPLTTMENARLNNVEKRVRLVTESMLDMSLPSNSFDAVFANVAIQNIKSRDGRREAIENIYRVTKPGGQIRIVDIEFIKEYRNDLLALGATDVKTKWFGMSGWFGNPLYASKLVSASKPK